GRTPDAPITKEVKPTAAIAWKKIAYGEIKRRGKTIQLVDCPPDQGITLKGKLKLRENKKTWNELKEPLRSVYIDTGENGIFSRSEFEAIATPGQMQYVTPEEIAEHVIYEIKGGNTGHDVINALDNATMGPTYRAGYLYESALNQLKSLEIKHNTRSIAFEILGPPRLSKLLYEAFLLHLTFGSMKAVVRATAKVLSRRLEAEIRKNKQLRSQIISIGIPILLSDGTTLLRGADMKIPPYRGENELPISPKAVDLWAHDGWVDLRAQNLDRWRRRFQTIIDEVTRAADTSSRHLRNKEFWNHFEDIDPGKLAGWIFSEEEHGKRMKA
ncbi:MAG TPA: short-chain dehydrogenase, partial [Bacteroidota bacterium]